MALSVKILEKGAGTKSRTATASLGGLITSESTGYTATNCTNTLHTTTAHYWYCVGTSTTAMAMNYDTSVACATGKKVYIRAKVLTTTDGVDSITLRVAGTTGGETVAVTQSNPVNGTYYTISGIVTMDASHTGNVRLRWYLYDASGATGSKLWVFDWQAIDLTGQFGAGSEPSASELDDFYAWRCKGTYANYAMYSPYGTGDAFYYASKVASHGLQYNDVVAIDQGVSTDMAWSNVFPLNSNWIITNSFYENDRGSASCNLEYWEKATWTSRLLAKSLSMNLRNDIEGQVNLAFLGDATWSPQLGMTVFIMDGTEYLFTGKITQIDVSELNADYWRCNCTISSLLTTLQWNLYPYGDDELNTRTTMDAIDYLVFKMANWMYAADLGGQCFWRGKMDVGNASITVSDTYCKTLYELVNSLCTSAGMVLSIDGERRLNARYQTITPSNAPRNLSDETPITNIVTNGNFTSTTGWSATWSTLSAASNVLSITADGTQSAGIAYQNTSIASVIGKNVYLKIRCRVTNSNCTSIQLIVDGVSAGTNQIYIKSNPSINTWYDVSFVATQPSDVSGNIAVKFAHYYINAATANGKVMEVQYVSCIDLTTDMGTEIPSSAQMDVLMAKWSNSWFDGTERAKNAWLSWMTFPRIWDVTYKEDISNYGNSIMVRGGYNAAGEPVFSGLLGARAITDAVYAGNATKNIIISDSTVTNDTDGDAAADYYYKRYGKVIPGELSFVTDDTDYRPDQKITTRLAGLGMTADKTMHIDSVNLYDVDGVNLLSKVVCSNRDSTDFAAAPNKGSGAYLTDLSNNVSSSVAALYQKASTFTPALQGSGTAGTWAWTTQEGWYIRIGNMCYVSIVLTPSSISGSPTNNLLLTGLPFTVAAVNGQVLDVLASGVNWGTSMSDIKVLLTASATTGTFYGAGNNVAQAAVPVGNIVATDNLRISGWYQCI